MENLQIDIDRQKTADLAFRVGVLLGSIDDKELMQWMSVHGFSYEQQKDLKELLRKLALCFYK